jgi:hypothetical protein
VSSFIPIINTLPVDILAGYDSSNAYESIAVGFKLLAPPSKCNLPQGNGFIVSWGQISYERSTAKLWLLLSRRPEASLEIFTAMAEDILSSMIHKHFDSDYDILFTFIERISAWQNFMGRGTDLTLSPEAELGLLGELQVIMCLFEAGMNPEFVMKHWTGPCNGLHDFTIGHGAIEVKSTVARGNFPAKIISLEQLDNMAVNPLFLAAIRFDMNQQGLTLPEYVDFVKSKLTKNAQALALFDLRLIEAGFITLGSRYHRKYTLKGIDLFEISDTFPKLTRLTVPKEIVDVRYTIDLELFSGPRSDWQQVTEKIGMS